MRIKATFTVFKRELASGRGVYYYQCYDAKGRRQWAKSTGLSKKTEAVEYCMKLFKDGGLIPEPKVPTFGEFAQGWWDIETCRYLKWRMLHTPITNTTLRIHRVNFRQHIQDYFSKYRLDEITPDIIEGWLLFMSGKVSYKNKQPLKAKTINLVFGTLKVMLGEAVRTKILKINPCNEVKELREADIERVILTVEEARKLFPDDWKSLWDSQVVYLAHKLAACTGLRIGELRGLRRENVFEDYISITGQYTQYGYVGQTKTKTNRTIPIAKIMRQELDELLTVNGNGYVFSDDGGIAPVTNDRINRQFNKALEAIGIGNKEKLERNLSFHSWRHFFNTLLRMSNVADSKVQTITGHKSLKMTNHYTHFDTRKFTEVMDVQTNLLTSNKPETEKLNEKQKSVKTK